MSYYKPAELNCRWCGISFASKSQRPRKWCSPSCRGKAERSRWTKERRERNRLYRRNSKWWRYPSVAEKHRARRRDWYEHIGRKRYGHIRRGERWSLPERQVWDYVSRHFSADALIPFDRNAIGLELDIYNQTKNWAIDVRGIYHYKAIYGLAHLEKVQLTDLRREEACKRKSIKLIILPVTAREGLLARHYELLEKSLW